MRSLLVVIFISTILVLAQSARQEVKVAPRTTRATQPTTHATPAPKANAKAKAQPHPTAPPKFVPQAAGKKVRAAAGPIVPRTTTQTASVVKPTPIPPLRIDGKAPLHDVVPVLVDKDEKFHRLVPSASALPAPQKVASTQRRAAPSKIKSNNSNNNTRASAPTGTGGSRIPHINVFHHTMEGAETGSNAAKDSGSKLNGEKSNPRNNVVAHTQTDNTNGHEEERRSRATGRSSNKIDNKAKSANSNNSGGKVRVSTKKPLAAIHKSTPHATRWTHPAATASPVIVEPVNPLLFSTHAWEPVSSQLLRNFANTQQQAAAAAAAAAASKYKEQIKSLPKTNLQTAVKSSSVGTHINVTFPLGGVVADVTLAVARPKTKLVLDLFFPCNRGINALYLTRTTLAEFTPQGPTGCVDLGVVRTGLHANMCAFRVTVEDNGRGDSDKALGRVTLNAAVAHRTSGQPTCKPAK